jgi:glycosyltransferase involved in cell wall biosynthesis
MSKNIHTSVLVTVYNRRELLRRTLEGYKLRGPHAGTELVLVDYWSTDEVDMLIPLGLEVFDSVKYIRIEKNKSLIPINSRTANPSLGFNVGAHNAAGDLLILTCPECYPLADNIRNMQEHMQYGRRNSYCFGKLLKATPVVNLAMDRWYPMDVDALTDKVPAAIEQCYISEINRLSFLYFAAIKKSALESVNGFDEEFMKGFSFEDDDFAQRVHRNGTILEWTDRCVALHQWHPLSKDITEKSDFDLNSRHYEENRKRSVIKANGPFLYGSRAVISENKVYWK